MIGEFIQTFVNDVFAEIQKDSDSHALLMDGHQRRIKELMGQAESCSSNLNQDSLVPDRMDLEAHRTECVLELWELFEKRASAVETPSKSPELLDGHLKEFRTLNTGNIEEERALSAQHAVSAEECDRTAARQQHYKEEQVQMYKNLEQVAESKRCSDKKELGQVVANICELLVSAKHLTHSICDQDMVISEARLKQTAIEEAMGKGVQSQLEQKLKHQVLRSRYEEGANVLVCFGDWLESSYTWLKEKLQEKRDLLKNNIPLEKERLHALLLQLREDLDRRMSEQKWAMEETKDKRNAKELEAARQERIPRSKKGRKMEPFQRAQELKNKVERLDQELESMDEVYKDLGKLYEKVDEKCQQRESGHESYWAQRLLYNEAPPTQRYQAKALQGIRVSCGRELEDGTVADGVLSRFYGTVKKAPGKVIDVVRRRITGKRPASELEVVAGTRRLRRRVDSQQPTSPGLPLSLRASTPLLPPAPSAGHSRRCEGQWQALTWW